MTRPAIPKTVAAQVAIRARRRCCICFGLHWDSGIKDGQIAHLDRNKENSDPENLVWLCLEHHDRYDTRHSQSKGYMMEEVKFYREKLDKFLKGEDKAHERFMRTPPAARRKKQPFELTPRHEVALKFFTSPHRTVSALLTISKFPQTAEEVNEIIVPHDLEWTTSILHDLENDGWITKQEDGTGKFKLTQEGREMLEALEEIPRPIKDKAWNDVWQITQ